MEINATIIHFTIKILYTCTLLVIITVININDIANDVAVVVIKIIVSIFLLITFFSGIIHQYLIASPLIIMQYAFPS